MLAQRARQNAEAELGELRARASAELEQVVSLAGVSTREVLIRVAPPPLRRSVGALIDGDPPATVARDATHRFVARELGSVPADAVLTLLSGSQPASEAVVDAAFAMALQRTGKEASFPADSQQTR
ncbi:MAG: hypothetical protein M5U09_01510 [Gammaproteobacteria bacterium]|nr:hypothetical protein [Gammaproteobacteria bacterium]